MNQSPNTPNNAEVQMNNEQLITELFKAYVSEGGAPRITSFRTHLNSLLSTHIKPLTGGSSGKSGDGSSWRTDLKARFGGRGRKWVFVPTETVTPALDEFDSRGVDTTAFRAWIERLGRAWCRFTGPRLLLGKPAAAFEVRTLGSTIDQPKELLLIPVDQLDELIDPLGTTPFALQLEFEVEETEEGHLVELETEVESEESVEEDVIDDDALDADDDDI